MYKTPQYNILFQEIRATEAGAGGVAVEQTGVNSAPPESATTVTSGDATGVGSATTPVSAGNSSGGTDTVQSTPRTDSSQTTINRVQNSSQSGSAQTSRTSSQSRSSSENSGTDSAIQPNNDEAGSAHVDELAGDLEAADSLSIADTIAVPMPEPVQVRPRLEIDADLLERKIDLETMFGTQSKLGPLVEPLPGYEQLGSVEGLVFGAETDTLSIHHAPDSLFESTIQNVDSVVENVQNIDSLTTQPEIIDSVGRLQNLTESVPSLFTVVADGLINKLLVIVLLIGYALMIYGFGRSIAALVKMFRYSYFSEMAVNESNTFKLFLNLMMLLAWGGCVVLLLRLAGMIPQSMMPDVAQNRHWEWIAVGGAFLLPLVVVLYQVVILKLVGRITRTQNFITLLLYTKKIVCVAATFLIMPVTLLLAFYDGEHLDIVLYVAAGLIIVAALTHLMRSFVLFRRGNFPILNWILYLCAVEILPLSFLALILVQGA